MSKLPSLKSRKVLSILFSHGFEKVRTSGSHVRLKKGKHYVTVPFHSRKTIPKGTFVSIIKQSGLSRKKFLSKTRK